MEKFFKLKEHKTNVKTEAVAGITTFFTMAYIISVNPSILALSGIDRDGVFIATILASIVGTLIMALYANLPYAQAPGMGLNAFFTFTVCFSMGFAWQEALAMVFVCGFVFLIATVTGVRKSIVHSIPSSLQNAIGGAIGIFIAYIGIKNAGLLTFTSDPGTYVDLGGTIITDGSIVPSLTDFSTPGPILALIGLILTIVLILLNVKGAIFIGIVLTTLLGIPMGIVNTADVQWFSFEKIGSIRNTAGAFFGDPGLVSMFSSPDRIFLSLIAIFAFCLSDMFDTIGTFIGTGRVSGIFDDNDEKILSEGKKMNSKMERGLLADATATITGSLLGTSNVTTYVESASGIAVGGRTGLASVFTAILFALCLPFAGAFGIIPAEATAPALIVVGIMMMSSFVHIKWNDFSEATPAFMTVVIMAFGYNISYGIAAGFIFYCISKLCTGKIKEVHPILIGSTGLFILNFVIQALRGAGKI